MRYLITAGPTREALDPVRFISNASSGQMGSALAQAAQAAGADVVLVSGPTALPCPEGVRRLDVVTTEEMHRAVLDAFPSSQVVLMAAAPCDYRPAEREADKHKKDGGPWSVQLEPTPDILAELGRRKDRQILVGFALETDDPIAHAREKMERKDLDLIVVNGPEAMAAPSASVVILHRTGEEERLPDQEKTAIARRLIEITKELWSCKKSK